MILLARYTAGGPGFDPLELDIDDLFQWLQDAEAVEREVAEAIRKGH